MTEERAAKRRIRQRGRRWSELLMENSSLRDNLTDDQAQQLLAWGLGQIKATAVATAELSDAEAEELLQKNGTAVKLIMQGVNDLIGGIGQPLSFDVIDDTLTRVLKNLRWLTEQPLSPAQLRQREQFNQARTAAERAAAFQALMALIEAGNE